MYTLQKLIFPPANSHVDCRLYGSVITQRTSRDCSTVVTKGKELSFDGFYNIFEPGFWKENCNISSVYLKIEGKGKAHVRFVVINSKGEKNYLPSQQVDLNLSSTLLVPQVSSDFIYVELKAITDLNIDSIAFQTNLTPEKIVDLAIVITHYNRLEYISKTIDKISNAIKKQQNDIGGHIHLCVVDNSQNIEVPNNEHLTIIKNENLGGSGGFARGLLWAKDAGFSHCLFMDDDGGCEFESINRTIAILSFSKERNLSIVGTGLYEDHQTTIHESGAIFTTQGWQPLLGGGDISTVKSTVQLFSDTRKIEYAAWPYFAFPIETCSHFPWPFFVRGDDVLFGLQNRDFIIKRYPGISVTIGNLVSREGPLSIYQDVRAIITINLLQNCKLLDLLSFYTRVYLLQLLSYKYATTRAISEALKDVLGGPVFYQKNVDNKEIRTKIKPFADAEKFSNDSEFFSHIRENWVTKCKLDESWIHKFIRIVTMNGTLFPFLFIKKQTIRQEKLFRANFLQIFGFKHILYECSLNNTYWLAEYNYQKHMISLFRLFKDLFNLMISYRKVKTEYLSNYQKVGSESFWRNIFSKE